MTLSPLLGALRMANPGMYTCTEVADALDTSPSSLRRLAQRRSDGFGPDAYGRVGGRIVWLYSMTRVEAVSAELVRRRRAVSGGRPRTLSATQRREHHALHSAASYWRRCARQHEAAGDRESADHAAERAREVEVRLVTLGSQA